MVKINVKNFKRQLFRDEKHWLDGILFAFTPTAGILSASNGPRSRGRSGWCVAEDVRSRHGGDRELQYASSRTLTAWHFFIWATLLRRIKRHTTTVQIIPLLIKSSGISKTKYIHRDAFKRKIAYRYY
jgi:hypothetical protein